MPAGNLYSFLHQNQNFLERRVALAPRHVLTAIRAELPILQMKARDPVVMFFDEKEWADWLTAAA